MGESLVATEALASQDFSLLALFFKADFVVQSVMIILILASFWCWAIIFDKMMKLSKIKKMTDSFENSFWSSQSLDDLYDSLRHIPNHPIASVFSSAMREWNKSLQVSGQNEASQERIERAMRLTVTREMDRLEKSMTFLASVGSIAPFVGLFGTVWGIMNSFQAIAKFENTNLSVVAPGIAEALFATALGLVAAIPAVLAYNKLSTELGRFAQRLENFSDEFITVYSRKFNQKAA